MLRQNQIAQVIDIQEATYKPRHGEILREQLPHIKNVSEYASIITGMRRVGKSTLLRQIATSKKYQHVTYLNFDDIRLTGFEADDFNRLYKEIRTRESKELFFDEIQLVKGWEIFIHQLLREDYTVYISGSNATLLSVDLGTHLTGRHLQNELFPFSYTEFLTFEETKASLSSFEQYMLKGGIPEYLRTQEPLILSSLLDDVLIRDIAVNKGVSNVQSLRQLAVYLLSNIGKPYSANRLKSVCGVASSTTVSDYISYMMDAYLVGSIGLYSDSLQVTARNPKKVYCYDTGLIASLSLSKTPDKGRLLENMVFIWLRHHYALNHIFYEQGEGECDFVAVDTANHPELLIQVCYELNDDNFQREMNGLTEAMRKYQLHEGFIITADDEDEFSTEAGKVNVVKAWKWMSEH
jgi:predicted AAA+ superfamily ATPase